MTDTYSGVGKRTTELDLGSELPTGRAEIRTLRRVHTPLYLDLVVPVGEHQATAERWGNSGVDDGK